MDNNLLKDDEVNNIKTELTNDKVISPNDIIDDAPPKRKSSGMTIIIIIAVVILIIIIIIIVYALYFYEDNETTNIPLTKFRCLQVDDKDNVGKYIIVKKDENGNVASLRGSKWYDSIAACNSILTSYDTNASPTTLCSKDSDEEWCKNSELKLNKLKYVQ